MNMFEARGKAYFILALLAEGIAAHMPEVFEQATREIGVSQEDMAAVRAEMQTHVSRHLREQGYNYKAIAEGGKNDE